MRSLGYSRMVRRVAMGAAAVLCAVWIAGCGRPPEYSKPAAEASAEQRPVRSTHICMAPEGIFDVGAEPGIHYYDYKSGQSAVIPGTGSDGLSLFGGNVSGLAFYGRRFYFFQRSETDFGRVDFVTLNDSGQDRMIRQTFVAQTGEYIFLGLGSWYADGACYTVKDTQIQHADPSLNTKLSALLRIDLETGAVTELASVSSADGYLGITVVGADETGVYYSVLRLAGDRLDEAAFEALPDTDERKEQYAEYIDYEMDYDAHQTIWTTGVWRFGSDESEELFSGKASAMLRPDLPIENALYWAQEGRIYEWDLKAGQQKMICELASPVSNLFSVVDGRLYAMVSESQTTRVKQIDLSDPAAPPADVSPLLPMMRLGDAYLCLGGDPKHYFDWISVEDFQAGHYDQLYRGLGW